MIDFEGRKIPNELSEIVEPSRTVLLVWDMQNDQAGGAFNKDALIRNAPPLIAAAAGAGIKTVYTRQTPYLWKDESAAWIHRFMQTQKVDHPSKLTPRRLTAASAGRSWSLLSPPKMTLSSTNVARPCSSATSSKQCSQIEDPIPL